MEHLEALLGVEEAASVLRVKPGTIYDWTARGVLPHVRILADRRRAVIRFRREDLLEFINSKRTAPASGESNT